MYYKFLIISLLNTILYIICRNISLHFTNVHYEKPVNVVLSRDVLGVDGKFYAARTGWTTARRIRPTLQDWRRAGWGDNRRRRLCGAVRVLSGTRCASVGVVERDVGTRRSWCGLLHIVWSITYRAFSCRRGGGCMQEGGRWCKAAGVAGFIEAPACAHHRHLWDPVRIRLLWYPVSVSFSFREEREEIWLMWVSCGPPGEQDDVSATL